MYVNPRIEIEGVASPLLYCPFPSAVSSHHEAVERHTLAWAESFGLLDLPRAAPRLRRAGAARLVAGAFPGAPLERLELLADLHAWLALEEIASVDDAPRARPDLVAARHDRYLSILYGAPVEGFDGPLERALGDLRRRILEARSGSWFNRFLRAMTDLLEARARDAADRARPGATRAAERIARRRAAMGADLAITLFGVSDGVTLPGWVRACSGLLALNRAAGHAIALMDAIFAEDDEARRGDPNGLVEALRREEGLTLDQAIDRVAALANAEVRTFQALEARMPSFGGDVDPHVRRHVARLRSLVRASVDGALAAHRDRPPPSARTIEPPPHSTPAAA